MASTSTLYAAVPFLDFIPYGKDDDDILSRALPGAIAFDTREKAERFVAERAPGRAVYVVTEIGTIGGTFTPWE